jgi:hypothetical protein
MENKEVSNVNSSLSTNITLNSDKEQQGEFYLKLNSNLHINLDGGMVLENEEWMDEILDAAPYITKALAKFNKVITTNEEIVKIELIKKVSVESIKHLSKNTNLISDVDKNGDVKPSKILSVLKEENVVTYENCFLYALIGLIEQFINIRLTKVKNEDFVKNKKNIKYTSHTIINGESIDYDVGYNVYKKIGKQVTPEMNEKIEAIKKAVSSYKMTEIYKKLAKSKVIRIKSPLKMTNVLLKNVNFQRCVKLWNYLNDSLDMENKAISEQKDYDEKGLLKNMMDDNFYTNYLMFNSLSTDKKSSEKNLKYSEEFQEIRRKLTNSLIDRIIEINPSMDIEAIKDLIAEKYVNAKVKGVITLKPVEDIFKEKINGYLNTAKRVRLN